MSPGPVLGLVLFPIQLFITAPYGRHARAGFGPTKPNRLGWIVMELVSPIVFAALFLFGGADKTAPMWIFLALWMAHYLHRALVFPFMTRTRAKTIPVLIVLSAMGFNVVNGGLNGLWLGDVGGPYPNAWLVDPRFLIGLALFTGGAVLNLWADYRLIALRAPGESGYRLPEGGAFDIVSCPNHLGEIIEWFGFALMCWNLPALSFAIWTFANLVPRALSHHRWYRQRFPDYPAGRKAVIPFVL